MSPRQGGADVRAWIADPLPDDVHRAVERAARTEDVRRIAVMPDVHLAHDVCVGLVVGTGRRLYPQAVGGDIGCGMAAIAFEAEAALLDDDQVAARVLDGLYRVVPANRHRHGTLLDGLPADLRDSPLSDGRLERLKVRDGRVQFATLGHGNHFLELQADDEGRLWLMVHSGSRAIGKAIHEHHLAKGDASNTGLRFLDASTGPGQAYLSDLAWALSYADRSRRAMIEAVARLLHDLAGVEIRPDTLIGCHHNFVRRERHGDEDLWVHRKGAISAQAGEAGIIPGSMAAVSHHVDGRGNPEALGSASHGAGREMSRTEARRRISAHELARLMRGVRFDVRMADRLRDEAPSAYKDIGAVMRAQRDLVRIVRRLRPVLSFKGA